MLFKNAALFKKNISCYKIKFNLFDCFSLLSIWSVLYHSLRYTLVNKTEAQLLIFKNNLKVTCYN